MSIDDADFTHYLLTRNKLINHTLCKSKAIELRKENMPIQSPQHVEGQVSQISWVLG